MKKIFSTKDVSMMNEITNFIGKSPDIICDEMIVWYLNDEEGCVEFNLEKREIGFIDAIIDTKTYFAIVGLSASWGYTVEDYFRA